MLSGVAVVAVLAAVPGVLAVAAVQALACFAEKCFFARMQFSFFTMCGHNVVHLHVKTTTQ